jgi:hypothetical protein
MGAAMTRLTQARCDQLAQVGEAHALVCRCLLISSAWEKAKTPDERQRHAQEYATMLEGLFQLLRKELEGLAGPVIDRVIVKPSPSLDEDGLRREVLDLVILNLFVAIVDALPRLPLDANTKLPVELLIVAEQCLYGID